VDDFCSGTCHDAKIQMGAAKFPLNNPMNQDRLTAQLSNIRAAKRCGARTRAGGSCQCPALRDRNRCRLHGGLSSGAPKGMGNGNYRSGTWTAEAIEERKWVRSLVLEFAKKDPAQ
jgi:hypothetical protein